MAASPKGPGRDPEAPKRTERALRELSRIIGDLVRTGTLVSDSDGNWTVNPSSGPVILAQEVFGQKNFLAGLPHCEDGFDALASSVFLQRVSYGTVG